MSLRPTQGKCECVNCQLVQAQVTNAFDEKKNTDTSYTPPHL